MTADQIIALAAVGVSVVGGIGALGWRLSAKLASIETIISREMTHNGGSSTKDYARAARDEAIAARDQAVQAKHHTENVDAKVDRVDAKVDRVGVRQDFIEKRLGQIGDVIVGMQAVQTFRDAGVPPGSTSSSTTITHTQTPEGTPA